jgi:orotidine-5'-phosphate decarboxylase
MTRGQLIEQIRKKRTYLCVGLDTDTAKIPKHLLSHKNPVFEFNRQIIDSTKDCCVAYKINTAFYESLGYEGWKTMEQTVEYIPSDHLKIADAKRGDIGNSSAHYAKAFFEALHFDALTVSPYMGEDSILPFLEYSNKWTIVLGLTSNSGAKDFEMQLVGEDYLYEKVIKAAARWGTPDNMMFVVGATQSSWFERVRRLTPKYFYLVPGVGAQGGSLEDISAIAMNADIGLLVNVSRSIIYASGGKDFAEAAAAAAFTYQQEMSKYIIAFPEHTDLSR